VYALSEVGRGSFDTHSGESLQASTALGNLNCHQVRMKPRRAGHMLQLTAHQQQRLASETGEERATSTAGFIQQAAETGLQDWGGE